MIGQTTKTRRSCQAKESRGQTIVNLFDGVIICKYLWAFSKKFN